MFCPKCGTECKDDWNNCPKCAGSLSSKMRSDNSDINLLKMIGGGLIMIMLLCGIGLYVANSSSKTTFHSRFVKNHEYVMPESSMVAKDLSSLSALTTCINNNDNIGLASLIRQGKIYPLYSRTKIDYGYDVDATTAFVYIKSGPYIQKSGYTFMKYIE